MTWQSLPVTRADAANHAAACGVLVGAGCRPKGGQRIEVIIVRVPGAARAALLAIIAASSTSCTQAIPASPSGTPSAAASAIATPASNPASPSPATSPASLSTCPASQLTIKLIYGGPAAGTIGGVIGFANHGSTSCQLAGWPTLIAAGPAQRVNGEHTLNVFAGPTLTRPPVVTIKPGARAVAVLAGGDHPGPGSVKCPPPFRRLLVAPPGSTRTTAIPAWIPNFDAYLPACTPIRISPVIPASDLPFRLNGAASAQTTPPR